MSDMKTATQNQADINNDPELRNVLASLQAAMVLRDLTRSERDSEGKKRINDRIRTLRQHARELGWVPEKKASRTHTKINMRG